jgi:sigma-B regulation protein RsbQ
MTVHPIIELSRFNLQIKGKGKQPMMFLHGYGCDQNMWRFVTPALEKDYKIILIDLIGSGKSDTSAYDYQKYSHLRGYADDILEICEAMQLKDVILVGHSVSAMSSLLATVSAPELFSKLIMIGPSPCYTNEEGYFGGFNKQDIESLIEAVESNYLGWASHITPLIMDNPDRPELSEELKESFCRNNPDIARHFARVTFTSDNRADLAKSPTKTLILQVKKDIIAPLAVGRYIQQQKPNSILTEIDTAGHCPHLSAPELTIQAIEEFLRI